MQKYPLWKPVLIVAVIVVCGLLLYPPSRKLKPGLDLAGGTSLVYQVDVPADQNAQDVIEQVIAVCKRRVDPQGVRNLVWRRLAGNRFEVQMAAPTRVTGERRDTYLRLLEAIAGQTLTERQIDRTLRLPAEERAPALRSLAGGNERQLSMLTELATAFDAREADRGPYQELEARKQAIEQAIRDLPTGSDERGALDVQLREVLAELIPVGRAFNQSRAQYEAALREVRRNDLDPAELKRILEMPDRPSRDHAPREAGAPRPTVRQIALEGLTERYPERAAEIQAVAEAYASYEQIKGPLDDPADLVTLMRGSGVLEFRIGARPEQLPDEESYRRALRERGPRAGSADAAYRWFLVDRDESGRISFAENARLQANLEADPVGYFRSVGLIGEEYAGEYYVLLSNGLDNSLTRANPDWQLTGAFPDMDQSGFSAVSFRLNVLGGTYMAQLTSRHIGEPMAIVLDDKVISAPRINDRIQDRGIITGGSGGFSSREMNFLIRTLNAGSLMASLSESPVSTKTTGPQLGQDNLRHGLSAAILALAAVAVFMVVYYFFGGLLAVFALAANMVIILGVMSLIQATWTLPGIAGIVLTIGMAVDANVLVLERIREEQFAGEPLHVAVRRGYDKALSTILDANITTMITCVVLYYTATTEVKGFALTLGIGIAATLFTSVFATRVIMETWLLWTNAKNLPTLPVVVPAIHRALEPSIDWVGKRKIFMAVSAVMMLVSMLIVSTRGAEMLDIEFRSGTEVTFHLRGDQRLNLRDVKDRLTEVAERHGLSDLRGDRASVVTVGDSQGAVAGAFAIQTLIEDSGLVSRVVKEAFEEYLDLQRPVQFKGVEAEGVREAPVFMIDSANLGESINRPVRDDVTDFVGGVAVVLEDMDPPVSEADVAERVRRMRLQPNYENLQYRRFEVIGLDMAPGDDAGNPLYRSMVVVSRDSGTNYLEDPQSFTEDPTGLAATEWLVVRDALTRDTSLGSVSNFSSQVSDTMKIQAIQAMVLSLIAVVIYVWLRFGRVAYGLAAIAALVHDVVIAMGLVALTFYIYDTFFGQLLMLTDLKINIALVAALLTIVGYSLNDTIVIFDRIRENRGRLADVTPAIINLSINQTFSRSVMTSGTTMLATLMLYIFGGDGVHGFAFSMFVGVLVGTYSSVAVAAPLLLFGRRLEKKLGMTSSPEPSAS